MKFRKSNTLLFSESIIHCAITLGWLAVYKAFQAVNPWLFYHCKD